MNGEMLKNCSVLYDGGSADFYFKFLISVKFFLSRFLQAEGHIWAGENVL